MKNFNLDYLQTFVAVIRHGSFSAAAERLDLSQPAVSQQIRQLERSLGAPLVERTGRRARATAAGQELLGHAAQIEAAVDAAVAAVARRGGSAAGRVRLGTGATACIFLLPAVLKDLRKRFPALEITVSTGNTAEIIKAVEDNLLDVGLVTMPVAGRMFDITPVLDDEFVLLAPPGMALPAKVTAATLADLPVLLFEPGGNTRRIADDWFARAGVRLAPVMSLGSVEAIKELVAAGLGCAILPGMAVPQGKLKGGVTVRALSPRLHRRLAVVIRRDKRLHAGLSDVVRSLQALGK
ncbi:LysR family transcriptional regulator [Herbaspirillum sp. LeCh32-8]|uniref:LysR family transcriptional regulator n=1 Tax=Herbaspirillum sp. LeCh32-8 TaxID=2821356 RepID=UPI001AE3DB21|nr:LysR family transcriptional regulator [Herbaspirillum sp. LeCh32-8]MBP0599535.1 LysR family transcriptional regulator [Herbaspirillum sp. LeCh32-8]